MCEKKRKKKKGKTPPPPTHTAVCVRTEDPTYYSLYCLSVSPLSPPPCEDPRGLAGGQCNPCGPRLIVSYQAGLGWAGLAGLAGWLEMQFSTADSMQNLYIRRSIPCVFFFSSCISNAHSLTCCYICSALYILSTTYICFYIIYIIYIYIYIQLHHSTPPKHPSECLPPAPPPPLPPRLAHNRRVSRLRTSPTLHKACSTTTTYVPSLPSYLTSPS